MRAPITGVPRGPAGTPGTFHITLDDSGAIGPSKGDHLDVDLNGGRFNGYSFSHNLSGGNLKVVDTTDLHRR